MTRWPVLLTAAAMLLAGGYQALANATSGGVAVFGAGCLLGAGMTIAGAWVATELRGPDRRD